MKEKERLEKRKELAIQKGLVIGTDDSVYKKVLKVYKLGFEVLLNNKINLVLIDEKINESGCSFNPSIKAKEIYKENVLCSNYIYCLNQFYIEKLGKEDIEKLKGKERVDEEVLRIVERTLKEVIQKEGVGMITYGQATPDTIIKNGTLVLKFIYGKNKEKFGKEEFMIVYKKQKEYIQKLVSYIETEIQNKWNIPAKVLVDKMV